MDKISVLPDELLLKILSWLPSEDLVATSFLSKRWRYLWKEVNTFRYDCEFAAATTYRFCVLIHGFSRIESLHLRLNPPLSRDMTIQRMVHIAASRSLRELRIKILHNSFRFELPESLYISSKLETLVLEKLTLADVPTNVCLVCLKRLHLLSVYFPSDKSVERFLSICPRLEDLVVLQSYLDRVGIFNINVPSLRSLSIDNSPWRSLSIDYSSLIFLPSRVEGFVINAPCLRSFTLMDSFSNYLRFENMPELVKAKVDVVYCDQTKFLGSLSSTQYLSLCCVTPQTTFPTIGTSFLSLDHLELCSCSVEWWNLLTLILHDAPRLRVLQLKLFHKHCAPHKGVMALWYQPDSVPECLSSHLEILEWRQYNGTEQEREAAKYILENGISLKKATFSSESAEKHGMLNELECVARGSKTCQLVFE